MISNNQNPKSQISYDDVQVLIRETDQLKAQHQFLLQQVELINHSINDLDGSKASLSEILTREVGDTVLIPLGSQVLIETKIESKDSVLFDLGSNILRKIPLNEAIEKINLRIANLKKSLTTLSTQSIQLESMIVQRENFLNQLVPISGANNK